MQPEQKANLDALARAVGESLALAWAHFHLLRGIDNGRLKHPQVVQEISFFYDRMWRAAFDAFFAKVGTILDNNRSSHSLPSLLTLARRSADPESKAILAAVESDLKKDNAPLAKLKRWRHEVVAHKPAVFNALDFYAQNTMTLTEIEHALEQLEGCFNKISFDVLGLYSEHRSAFEGIVQQAESLFKAADVGFQQHK